MENTQESEDSKPKKESQIVERFCLLVLSFLSFSTDGHRLKTNHWNFWLVLQNISYWTRVPAVKINSGFGMHLHKQDIHGDSDPIVPYEDNTEIVMK